MTKRDEGIEPGAQPCPNLTSQLIVFSVGLPTKDDRRKGNDVAYEISTVNCQEKLAQACSLDGHRINGQKPCADALYHSQWNINFRATTKKVFQLPSVALLKCRLLVFKKADRKT